MLARGKGSLFPWFIFLCVTRPRFDDRSLDGDLNFLLQGHQVVCKTSIIVIAQHIMLSLCPKRPANQKYSLACSKHTKKKKMDQAGNYTIKHVHNFHLSGEPIFYGIQPSQFNRVHATDLHLPAEGCSVFPWPLSAPSGPECTGGAQPVVSPGSLLSVVTHTSRSPSLPPLPSASPPGPKNNDILNSYIPRNTKTK